MQYCLFIRIQVHLIDDVINYVIQFQLPISFQNYTYFTFPKNHQKNNVLFVCVESVGRSQMAII